MRTNWEQYFDAGEEKVRQFARSINDYNPLHYDVVAAKAAGLDGIVAPGVMVLGFISATIAEEVPNVMVRKLEIEFLRPLYAGSTPSVLCTVLRKRQRLAQVEIVVKNKLEEIARGSCMLFLPVFTAEETLQAA